MLLDRHSQAGLTLVELMVGAFIGMMAIAIAMSLYLTQHKSHLRQTSITDAQMNAQFVIGEVQHHLMHAGLGLPREFQGLMYEPGRITVRLNPTKRQIQRTGRSSPASGVTRIEFAPADAEHFRDIHHAIVRYDNSLRIFPILAFDPSRASVDLPGDIDLFETGTNPFIYPAQEFVLLLDQGYFRIDRASSKGPPASSLGLAEGVSSLVLRFKTKGSGIWLTNAPLLNDLEWMEIDVTTRALTPGMDDIKQNLKTRVAYRGAWR